MNFLKWEGRRSSLAEGLRQNWWKYQMNPVLFQGSNMIFKVGPDLKYKKHKPIIFNTGDVQDIGKFYYAVCQLEDPRYVFICGGW